MKTATSKIGNQITEFIAYDDNRYVLRSHSLTILHFIFRASLFHSSIILFLIFINSKLKQIKCYNTKYIADRSSYTHIQGKFQNKENRK